jgi:asparagine synthase (glutamine-hydrolysing)
VVVALNGELYDHARLRRDLETRGHSFRSGSDTEVLLRLYQEHGEGALERLDGMFALAIWDARRRTLLLARDRMGEKPLVWFEAGGDLVFASELQALAQHPEAPRDPDPDALALYLLHRFVPAPRTGLLGMHRLPPGHLLTWREGRATVRPWWSLPVPERGGRGAGPAPAAEVARVRTLLEQSVEARRHAEVPVGVFLSGGVDSAAIAALAALSGPISTFTLRPDDPDFDEGNAARATALRLKTDHHEVALSAVDLERGFEEVFERIDEPIGDASLVPTLHLARAARTHVKVVLGGEGADELFGGYPTYLGARWARWLAPLPRGPLLALARRASAWSAAGNVGIAWMVWRLVEGARLEPLERHLAWFGAFPAVEQALLWHAGAMPPCVGEGLLDTARAAVAPALGTGDPVDALLRADLLLHLPDALLAKVDRATMAVGLEARAPFLERRLVEAVAAMPASWKVRGLKTKVLLKRALTGLLPREVLRRKKRGFAVPVSRALLGPLGERLRARLTSSRLTQDLLDPTHGLALLDEHRRGAADHGRKLYALLALLEWGERRLQAAPTSPPRNTANPPSAKTVRFGNLPLA